MGFFFFKQKTAYDMRISDWSSDVCSSDLSVRFSTAGADKWDTVDHDLWAGGLPVLRGCLASLACRREALYEGGDHVIIVGRVEQLEIGRAPCRERVCKYVEISVVAVSIKTK